MHPSEAPGPRPRGPRHGEGAGAPAPVGVAERRRGLLGAAAGAFGATSAWAAAAAAAAPGPQGGGAVLVDSFGTPGQADDTAAIRRAIEEAGRLGAVVVFSGREYRVSDTIDLPTGVQLIGAGAVSGPGPNTLHGTVLRRTRDRVLLRARGTTFLRGGPMRHSIAVRGILFHGGDQPSDAVQLIAASRVTVEDCFFFGSRGRHLLLWEAFDCRIQNTDFEWGGAAGTGVPMVELRSGGGMEYTNQIHFVGCRCESYPGTAIALTGGNTNEIFFTNCKLEGALPESNEPALTIARAVMVRFGGLQVTSKGSRGNTIRALVAADESAFLIGDLLLEHIDADGQGAKLAAYLDLGGSRGVDLRMYVYDGLRRLPPEAYVALDRSRASACTVRGMMRRGGEIVARTWSV